VRRRVVAGAVVVAGVVLAASACGTGGLGKAGDASHGQQLFTQKCGFCHTLADASTSGAIGPNLDAAFARDRQEGYAESSIRAVVLDQIRLAISPMPKNIVRGQDAEDVATYVAKVAGVHGAEAKPAPSTATGGAALFTSNGCTSCHTLKAAKATGKIGPDLDKLPAEAARAKQPLASFVKTSIVDPNAYIEPGFPKGVMPQTFGKTLTAQQLAALVQYLIASSKGG
jgi:mono/diheme cytochrome c family protein